MIQTPTKQTPSECKHYLGVALCEFQDEATLEPQTTCVLFCVKKHCHDYQPKEKKDNDSRTTENN